MKEIVLDTETTGLSPQDGHKIIEIGCVELIDRQITKKHWHVYINPQREVEDEAIAVHGITNEFLNDKPVFADIADDFVEFVRDAELIIHNAPFDIGFLNHELKQLKTRYARVETLCTVTDSLALAREKHPGQRNSLDALCKRYHVDNTNRELHGALLDSELLAQVYLYMTGGQSQLFDTTDVSDAPDSTAEKTIEKPINREALPIIQPNEAELAAHQQYLTSMQEKGACEWLESDQ